jgi:hypothetical protein
MTNAEPAGASPDFEELEPLQDLPIENAPAPAVPAGAPKSAGGPREIEKAPLMLQKAAVVLIVASLLPWLVPEGWNLIRLAAKVFVLLGGWVAYCGIEEKHGTQTPLHSVGAKTLPILGLVIMVVGVGLTLAAKAWQGTIEASALAVGLLAWTAVHGYSRGGKFNPSWALIIPMFGIAGLVNVLVVLGLDVDMVAKLFAILGSLGVVAAGGFAGYTMFVSMKEAKAHGEAKKRAASEARMAERRAKRPGGGAPPPAPPAPPAS